LASLQRRASWSRGGFIFIFLIASTAAVVWAKAQAAPPPSTTILNHLNQAISWYRRVAGLDVAAGQPSDTLYLENARNSAVEALQLAFQSASAQATLLAQQKNSGANANNAASSDQTPQQQQGTIAKALADATAHVADMQSQIADLNDQIAKATAKTRPQLVSQRDALQGELDLEKTIQDSLQKIASVANNETAGSGLSAQIAQLKQSVPEVFATAKEASASGGQSSKASAAQNTGLFGEASILFGQMRDMHDIDQLMSETMRLRDTAENLDAPLKESLKTLVQQGRAIVNQQSAPTDKQSPVNAAQIAATRKQFAALTTQFKQVADAAVPLRQEIILLDQTHGELLEWRNSIGVEYGRVLRSVLTRVGGILLALAVLFGLGRLWRHATYKYIHDARRRRQLTLIRRFVIGFLMGGVVVSGFITEFSSLATFAGFLTAGIAVALQTIILSLAAYFFLVGRYGVRVGDRVTVSGVTGDVVEVGLVRLYLMELAGTGIDLYPTGRVVVFSNSVMFQAAPFFKQLPGTAYAWHEIAVMLAPGGDPANVEKKVLDAVTAIYSDYQHTIERQHALVERILDASVAAPIPKAALNYTETGLQLTVRYPVEIAHAADIDDKVTRKLLEVIAGDPDLKAAVTGSPALRAPIKA
jgi:small-conductance mechanosensitive channel